MKTIKLFGAIVLLLIAGVVLAQSMTKQPNATFPKPAYDSGWLRIDRTQTFNHFVGGDVENYVVDLQFKNFTTGIPTETEPGKYGINNKSFGGDFSGSGQYISGDGAYYYNLTSTSITIREFMSSKTRVRFRIWVYE